MNILEAVRDPKLFAPWFRDTTTWQAWFSFLADLATEWLYATIYI